MGTLLQSVLEVSSGYSAFNHLSFGLKSDRVFGMFRCFFDEGGGEDHGFIAVCGYVASLENWKRFEAGWKAMLAEHGVPYLHMKHLAHFKGPYAKWKHDESGRIAFLRDAGALVCGSADYGFVCAARYADFDSVNREYYLAENFHSPYALAGRFCVARANLRMGSIGRSVKEIDYVFDRGGPDVAGLVELMQRSNLQIPSFKPSLDTENEAGMVQLQAADYFAYEVRKAMVDHSGDSIWSDSAWGSGGRWTAESLVRPWSSVKRPIHPFNVCSEPRFLLIRIDFEKRHVACRVSGLMQNRQFA